MRIAQVAPMYQELPASALCRHRASGVVYLTEEI